MGSRRRRVTTGYEYYGSFAQAICMGPIKTLHAIRNGDTVIYEGPLQSSSMDNDGKTILATTIGTVRFYWGTPTQNVDSLLNALQLDMGTGLQALSMPAYRGVAYVVCDNVAFGQQVVPPTLEFDVQVDASGLGLSVHTINQEAVLPEVVYQILLNKFWGLGLATANVDAASFVTAGEILITEGIGISPVLDDVGDGRSTFGQLFPYGDIALYWDGGKIKAKALRYESPAGLTALTEADLLEEPRPINEMFRSSWNQTVVNFKDRDQEWEDAAESYIDHANLALLGERVMEKIDLPFVTRRDVAKLLAKRKGVVAGLPQMGYELRLKPSHRTLLPSQRITLTYAKLGISSVVLRIVSRHVGPAENPDVILECIVDNNRDESKDFVVSTPKAPANVFVGPTGTDAFALASTTPYLIRLPGNWLPTTQTTNEGILVGCAQPNAATDGAELHFTWDENASPYRGIALAAQFPVAATLIGWTKIRQSSYLYRLLLPSTAEAENLQVMGADADFAVAVSGYRKLKTYGTPKNQHQVDPTCGEKSVSGYLDTPLTNVVDIEVSMRSTSPVVAYETLAGDGVYPTQVAFFGRTADFLAHAGPPFYVFRSGGNAPVEYNGQTTTDPDAARKRYFKVTTMNAQKAQSLGDVSSIWFDKDDTTMCADGTLSREWGEYAPSMSELLDVAGGTEVIGGTHPRYANITDVDEAFYDLMEGLQSDDEWIKWNHVDETLGSMILSGRTYYNPVP